MSSIFSKLSEIYSWTDFFSFANSLKEKEKGDLFECLTKQILVTKPEYNSILKNVWLFNDIPSGVRDKLNLPSRDEGIDLVTETIQGHYWAIQCKFKGQNQSPTYKELSTFTQLANNYCKNISLALLVHTGEKGVRKRHLLGEKYSEVGLEFWLGTGKVASQFLKYKSYKEAKSFVHVLNLKSNKEWREFNKSMKKPINIPANPDRTYSGKGWTNWGDWLGTGAIAAQLKEYRPFIEAKAFVHKLSIKNRAGWEEYCQSGKKPDDIPSYPNQSYLNKGWFSWGDWLGNGFVATQLRKYCSFEEARVFSRMLNLKNTNEWSNYCKSGNKPDVIPNRPDHVYKKKGWINWADWLGK